LPLFLLCKKRNTSDGNVEEIGLHRGQSKSAFLARTEHIIVELHGHYGFQCFQRDIAPYGLVAQKGRPPDTYMVTARRPL
jgi:hypothetical protein